MTTALMVYFGVCASICLGMLIAEFIEPQVPVPLAYVFLWPVYAVLTPLFLIAAWVERRLG